MFNFTHRENFRKSFIKNVEKLFSYGYDFIFPPICFVCEKRNHNLQPLCNDCYNQLMNAEDITVHEQKCDFNHLSESLCFNQLITIWPYINIIESIIHQIKYNQRKKLGFFLGTIAGRLLSQQLQLSGAEIIIPVPLHKIRYRERGYNQSSFLAAGLSGILKLSIYEKAIVRIKKTKSQTTLNAEQRSSNLKDAFEVKEADRIHSKTVLLVDDVSTTGATINSCSYSLKSAGAEKIIGLAMSRPVFGG